MGSSPVSPTMKAQVRSGFWRLVTRSLDPDGKELGRSWKSSLVGRYGQD
jgi:hypothetical protein